MGTFCKLQFTRNDVFWLVESGHAQGNSLFQMGAFVVSSLTVLARNF